MRFGAILILAATCTIGCSAPPLDVEGKRCAVTDPCPEPWVCVHRQDDADRCRLRPDDGDEGIGLLGQYFHGIAFDALAFERVDAQVRFDWGEGSPAEPLPANQFSIRWTGFIRSDVSGTHAFHTLANDGVRLTIDGTTVFERWQDAIREDEGTIVLEAGRRYPVALEYYENANTAFITLSWAPPGQMQVPVPSEALSPPAHGPPNE